MSDPPYSNTSTEFLPSSPTELVEVRRRSSGAGPNNHEIPLPSVGALDRGQLDARPTYDWLLVVPARLSFAPEPLDPPNGISTGVRL